MSLPINANAAAATNIPKEKLISLDLIRFDSIMAIIKLKNKRIGT